MSEDTPQLNGNYRSGWPYIASVVLACATFPLIWIGGLVTTYDVGMAVPDWPTTYGYNMFLYPMATWLQGPWGILIEHGHRLLGSLVGLLTILLNIAIWRRDPRGWMRWVGAAALILVISQGVLGGLRVRLSSTEFARLHGMTGPVFFAFIIGVCVMTSRYWLRKNAKSAGIQKQHVIDGWMFVALAYLQLVLGAHLRHPGIDWSPKLFQTVVVFHVLMAFVLPGLAIHIAAKSRRLKQGLSGKAWVLLLLVFCQVVLGIATWRAKYGWPKFLPMVSEATADQPLEIATHNALVGTTVRTASTSQVLTVTGHVALGSLILAAGVAYAVRVSRSFIVSRAKSNQECASAPTHSVVGGAVG